MTVEQKLEALYEAVNEAWDNAFEGWEWSDPFVEWEPYVLGEKCPENGFAFFLGGCEAFFNGLIWIEYKPEEDIVEICVEGRPIKDYLIEDLKNLFEKHSPFNMTVSYNSKTIPVISRKEKPSKPPVWVERNAVGRGQHCMPMAEMMGSATVREH